MTRSYLPLAIFATLVRNLVNGKLGYYSDFSCDSVDSKTAVEQVPVFGMLFLAMKYPIEMVDTPFI